MLPPAQIDRLLTLLTQADRPLLLHCRGGADRSGLTAALYVAAVAKLGEHAAERQLSIWYGHVGLPHLSSTYEMDRTWETIESRLGFTGS